MKNSADAFHAEYKIVRDSLISLVEYNEEQEKKLSILQQQNDSLINVNKKIQVINQQNKNEVNKLNQTNNQRINTLLAELDGISKIKAQEIDSLRNIEIVKLNNIIKNDYIIHKNDSIRIVNLEITSTDRKNRIDSLNLYIKNYLPKSKAEPKIFGINFGKKEAFVFGIIAGALVISKIQDTQKE